MSRFSATVSSGKMRRPSGTWQIPRRTIRSGARPWMGRPSNRISPRRGGTMPLMAMSVVDLPAPLAPIRVTISPSSTRRLTSRRAWTAP